MSGPPNVLSVKVFVAKWLRRKFKPRITERNSMDWKLKGNYLECIKNQRFLSKSAKEWMCFTRRRFISLDVGKRFFSLLHLAEWLKFGGAVCNACICMCICFVRFILIGSIKINFLRLHREEVDIPFGYVWHLFSFFFIRSC